LASYHLIFRGTTSLRRGRHRMLSVLESSTATTSDCFPNTCTYDTTSGTVGRREPSAGHSSANPYNRRLYQIPPNSSSTLDPRDTRVFFNLCVKLPLTNQNYLVSMARAARETMFPFVVKRVLSLSLNEYCQVSADSLGVGGILKQSKRVLSPRMVGMSMMETSRTQQMCSN